MIMIGLGESIVSFHEDVVWSFRCLAIISHQAMILGYSKDNRNSTG